MSNTSFSVINFMLYV